jgi:hypothetical protein
MTLVISLNGTDASTQKVYVDGEMDQWQSSPVITRDVVPIANRMKNILSDTYISGPRQLVIPTFGNTFTLSDRVTSMDWLKGWLNKSVTVRFADGTTTRELIGTVTSVPMVSIATANNVAWRGSFVVLADDPLWRDTSDTVSGSITTVTTIPLGTGPTEDAQIAVTVSGGSDPRTITFTFGGTVSTVCTWTGTIGANTLHVDLGADTVLNNVTNANSGWVGPFPSLDPRNGTVTLTMTCSSGTATAVVTYRKRYL